MSVRAIGTANISFGLVSIPVKLFSAADSSAGISFNMLHGKRGSRVRQQYICPKEDNIVVPRDEIRKGYEFAKDQYVLFTSEELKALEEEPRQTVEVTEFVPIAEIDPVYFDKAYYLGPDKGGSKAYFLLSETLKRTGRVALAKYAARGKQYLVMLRPKDGGLVMQQLLYADEIRPISEIGLDREPVQDAELKLAEQVISSLSGEWTPEDFENDYRRDLAQMLEAKLAGQEIVAPEPITEAPVIDLMEALRQSVADAQTRRSAEGSKDGKAASKGGSRSRKAPAKKSA